MWIWWEVESLSFSPLGREPQCFYQWDPMHHSQTKHSIVYCLSFTLSLSVSPSYLDHTTSTSVCNMLIFSHKGLSFALPELSVTTPQSTLVPQTCEDVYSHICTHCHMDTRILYKMLFGSLLWRTWSSGFTQTCGIDAARVLPRSANQTIRRSKCFTQIVILMEFAMTNFALMQNAFPLVLLDFWTSL